MKNTKCILKNTTLGLLTLVTVFSFALRTESAFAAKWGKSNWSEGKSMSSYQKPYEKSFTAPFAPGSHNLALDLGQVFLMGDLASAYEDNIGFRGHYTYGVSDMFGFDTSLGYSGHSDGKFSMTTLLTGLRANLSWYDKVVPHLIFGLGFYMPNYQVSKTSSVSPVLFGLHLGPGVDLQLSDEFFFGSGLTIHNIFGTTKFLPDGSTKPVGGSFITFLLHAGVTF